MKIENKTPIAEEIIRNNPTGHGLFAGISIVFIQAEQRNPLEPIPIIHVVSFAAAGKYGLILP